MKWLNALWFASVMMLGLSACGNKGPLYLPDPQAGNQLAQEASKTPQKQHIEKKQ